MQDKIDPLVGDGEVTFTSQKIPYLWKDSGRIPFDRDPFEFIFVCVCV